MRAPAQPINGFTPQELKRLYSMTFCSDPGLLRLDPHRLARFHPEWFPNGLEKFVARLCHSFGKLSPVDLVKWQLLLGDRSPAIVVSAHPFRVAAYSEELDGIAMLEFDPSHVDAHLRTIGTRLVTLNFDYSKKFGPLAADLSPGEAFTRNWTNFLPLIGDFLSNEKERLAQLKESVPESWWDRVWTMAEDYDYRQGVRDGRPGRAAQPSVGQHTWRITDRGH